MKLVNVFGNSITAVNNGTMVTAYEWDKDSGETWELDTFQYDEWLQIINDGSPSRNDENATVINW